MSNPEEDKHRLERLGALAIEEAGKCGASAAELSASTNRGLSVKVRMGEVDTVEHHRDKSMGITVYFGTRKASATSTDFSEAAVCETVRAACGIAKFTSEDPHAGLADASLMARDIPDLDLYHPWDIDVVKAIELAIKTESAARDYDKRITNADGTAVSQYQGTSLYCNSHGFCGSVSGTRHGLSCSVIASENSHMQRDYWYSTDRDPDSLDRASLVGRKAAMQAVSRLGARSVKTGEFPVLFSAEMTRGLISGFISSISGSALYRRNSFNLDKLGKQVFSDFVRISEDPLISRALGSSPFDGDGLARRPRDIVSNGILKGYVLSTYTARKLGMQSTANSGGARNVTLHGGKYSEKELLNQLGTGLLVTEMMGQGIKLATGDYSRGAAGFWVEEGQIKHPVQEVTVAGNLRDMFMNIVAIGNTLDTRGNIRTPAIIVRCMTVAGK